MLPLSGELSVSSESSMPNARAFVRSLNVLLKYARLYGLEHARSANQFDAAWTELQEATRLAGPSGLLLGASESQLLLDGVPLESTHAERSFANLLNNSGVASVCFSQSVERDGFANLIRAFVESSPKAGPLADRLEKYFGKDNASGIRVNEVRFVAEDAAFAEARVAAQLTIKTLGADAGRLQDWFRSPEKMIQLIALAEGAHGGSGPAGAESGSMAAGNSAQTGSDGSPATGSFCGASSLGVVPGGAAVFENVLGGAMLAADSAAASPILPNPSPLQEAELHSLLRLLSQFGQATHERGDEQLDPSVWQQRLGFLPQNAQITLRQALAGIAAQSPHAQLDEAALLRLAEDLAIRFALERYQRGEVRVNAVRQMLDRMGHELETLRKILKSREDKMTRSGLSVESHADVLDRQFWAAVPESGKRRVLNSSEAWCIPPRNVRQYVEELLGRGESEAAGDILVKYASCVRNKDIEARKKAALGLGQLAELYSKAASRRLQDALAQIGQQLVAEKDAELQTLLSAAFVRLSQESASRRYYKAMQQSLDSLADLGQLRPTWVQNLRPRIGVEARIPEFIEEAIRAELVPDGLAGVLIRVPHAAAEHLATRLSRAGRRTELERILELATSIGPSCARHLTELLRNGVPAQAASVVGLLSRLDASAVEELVPERLRTATRSVQDAIVRQLAIAGAPERGKILANAIEVLDNAVLPLALDEIGMCGDPSAAGALLRFVQSEPSPEDSGYLRVKAIEALGRMRAPAAVAHLRHIVETRKTFGWAYPEELRMAAAQALLKLDPEWIQAYLPGSGLDLKTIGFAPLDPAPEQDIVRHRRYPRIRLPRSVPVVITSARGKYSSAISVLSLDGGLLSGELQLAVGTEATLRIPAGLRSISMQAVVRFVRSHQAGFETVGMGLDDRAKLRRLLLSYGAADPSAAMPYSA